MGLLSLLVCVVTLLAACASSQTAPSPNSVSNGSDKPGMRDSDGQRFTCNTGYSLHECLEEIAILQKIVRKYPLKALGQWNWILVKTEDWKPLIVKLGFDTNSPALTCSELKQTFVEEAIIVNNGNRTRELTSQWKMSRSELLEYAVAHEMAHGICNDTDEVHTRDVAASLRASKPFACRTVRVQLHKLDSALPEALPSAPLVNR